MLKYFSKRHLYFILIFFSVVVIIFLLHFFIFLPLKQSNQLNSAETTDLTAAVILVRKDGSGRKESLCARQPDGSEIKLIDDLEAIGYGGLEEVKGVNSQFRYAYFSGGGYNDTARRLFIFDKTNKHFLNTELAKTLSGDYRNPRIFLKSDRKYIAFVNGSLNKQQSVDIIDLEKFELVNRVILPESLSFFQFIDFDGTASTPETGGKYLSKWEGEQFRVALFPSKVEKIKEITLPDSGEGYNWDVIVPDPINYFSIPIKYDFADFIKKQSVNDMRFYYSGNEDLLFLYQADDFRVAVKRNLQTSRGFFNDCEIVNKLPEIFSHFVIFKCIAPSEEIVYNYKIFDKQNLQFMSWENPSIEDALGRMMLDVDTEYLRAVYNQDRSMFALAYGMEIYIFDTKNLQLKKGFGVPGNYQISDDEKDFGINWLGSDVLTVKVFPDKGSSILEPKLIEIKLSP